MAKTIQVDYLARVEGEGALYVKMSDKSVEEVQLNIFEPPRFFEAFLRGRSYAEAPDITARICGICPVAYQMSSCHAMEDALGIKVDGALRELRRLLYCGEWLESNALHAFMLHAPDFLGYQDAIAMAKDHPQLVKDGLQLKKIGNEILAFLGGREIHPINVRVGGFYRVPYRREFDELRRKIEDGLPLAVAATRAVADFDFPDFEQDYEFVCLSHPDEYPMNEGRLVSNKGLDIDVRDWADNFEEEHVAHSNALHCVRRDHGSYLVGPLARLTNCFDRLSPKAREVAEEVGIGPDCRNPFKSIVARCVELVFNLEEAMRVIDAYERPDAPFVEHEARAGKGQAVTEAPRGSLYHRYELDDDGMITDAVIAAPTSQNQKRIEDDLRAFVPDRMALPEDELTWKCEQAVRNYDPCISCSAHFLKVTIDRA